MRAISAARCATGRPRRQVALVEVEPRRAHERERRPARLAALLRELAQRHEVPPPLPAAAEVAEDRLQRLVRDHPPGVAGRQERRARARSTAAPAAPGARARAPGGRVQVELRRRPGRLAAREVLRHDRRARAPARAASWRGARRAAGACARGSRRRARGRRRRARAGAGSPPPRRGDRTGRARRGASSPRRRRAASGSRMSSLSSGPPATASQFTTSCSAGGSSRRRSPMSCSSVEGSGSSRSPCARGAPARAAPPGGACSTISSVPRSRSASIISSRKNGLPATRGTSSPQTAATPVAHAEAGLDEAHLLLGAEAAELDPHEPSMNGVTRSSGRVRSSTSTGSRSARCFRSSERSSRLGRSAHWRPSMTTTSGWWRASAPSR